MSLLDDLTEATIIRKDPRELEKLCGNAGIEIKLLIDTFRHTHVDDGSNNMSGSYPCKQCRLDLRHPVHRSPEETVSSE